jgi:regulator of RNase E activity RraA
MGDIEVHNLAAPGDVLVVQGVEGVSSLGGISARLGRRQREAGAIVDGSVRDLASLRELGYPVWARGASPLTGKHRLRTVEINGTVTIGGRTVAPGDLAVADDTGVCFVPAARAGEVLARARGISAKEAERVARIDAGESVRDLARG